ncbi:MAG TPA: NUDIX domain-containing protein [Blastocatellia bacterium]
MPKKSSGLLMYRRGTAGLEFLLVHPGGPFWVKKDLGSWSIPKGEFGPDEDALAAAEREFEEETGLKPTGPFTQLAPVKQAGGKIVYAWAFEGDWDTATIKSNTFTMEWPPKSGKQQEFPEVDRAEWFVLDEARAKILQGQVGILDEVNRLFSGE